jgi:hypothetical protein
LTGVVISRVLLRTVSFVAAMIACASVVRAQSGEFKVIYTETVTPTV